MLISHFFWFQDINSSRKIRLFPSYTSFSSFFFLNHKCVIIPSLAPKLRLYFEWLRRTLKAFACRLSMIKFVLWSPDHPQKTVSKAMITKRTSGSTYSFLCVLLGRCCKSNVFFFVIFQFCPNYEGRIISLNEILATCSNSSFIKKKKRSNLYICIDGIVTYSRNKQ